MKTKDWLLKKLIDSKTAERHMSDTVCTTQNANSRLAMNYSACMEEIGMLKQRIIDLAPEKQFRIFGKVEGEEGSTLLHTISVASLNGVTDITVFLP